MLVDFGVYEMSCYIAENVVDIIGKALWYWGCIKECCSVKVDMAGCNTIAATKGKAEPG
jgi:hypothetical protein